MKIAQTFWRFAGAFSRMPSVSAALWAACIHLLVGARGGRPPSRVVHDHMSYSVLDSRGRHGLCASKLYFTDGTPLRHWRYSCSSYREGALTLDYLH